MGFAGLISNAVGMAGVVGKFEQDKVRGGAVCVPYGVVAYNRVPRWLVMVHQIVDGVPIRFDRFENVAANRVIKPSSPHENQSHQPRTLW